MRLSCLDGVRLKTRDEIGQIRPACQLAARVVDGMARLISSGAPLRDLETTGYDLAGAGGAEDVCICLSLDDAAVHGRAGRSVLDHGDVVSVDVSLRLRGWYGDCARSFVPGGDGGEDGRDLVEAASRVARAGVNAVSAGGPISGVARAATAEAARCGYAIVGECVGHGLGRALHEEPEVSFCDREALERFVAGMVVTIEPVVVEGEGAVVGGVGPALWTADGGRAAHFEHAVAVFRDRIEVLTDLDSAWVTAI